VYYKMKIAFVVILVFVIAGGYRVFSSSVIFCSIKCKYFPKAKVFCSSVNIFIFSFS